MPKAKCPKCGGEGECKHFEGDLQNGVFYNVYDFECFKCGHGVLYKEGVKFSDPTVTYRVIMGSPHDFCPYCSGRAEDKLLN